jgi:hypothetical protein
VSRRLHWRFAWRGRPRPARELFRWVDVPGAHASTVRRLLRLGPWSILIVRYRPGPDPAATEEL